MEKLDTAMSVACLMSLMMVDITHSSVLSPRTACSEGYILWSLDLTCHRPLTQGPCPDGQILVDHIQGPFCRNLFQSGEVDPNQPPGGSNRDSGWTVPNDGAISHDEEACLQQEKVLWPGDGNCYELLTQGPCSTGEWLVLDTDVDAANDSDNDHAHANGDDPHHLATDEDDDDDDAPQGFPESRVVCKPRLCPCDPALPELCEVEVAPGPHGDSGCRCRVALAAAQDGLCRPGEQLLVGPTGYGICGCIRSPPHVVWPSDGLCYPLHTRGPCFEGFQVAMSMSKLEPVCLPALCSVEGEVMWHDGQCYQLGTRGPCPEMHVLAVDEDNIVDDVFCQFAPSQVKRLFDMIPQGFVRDAPIGRRLRTPKDCQPAGKGNRRCIRSFTGLKRSRGTPKKNGIQLLPVVDKERSRNYLRFLNSFRNKEGN